MLKKTAFVLLLIGVAVSPAWGQAKKVRFSVHYGSLAGAGVGGSYYLSPARSLELTLGTRPFDGGIGQPFAGNLFNLTAGFQFTHRTGLYLAPGFHAGYYRMTANDKHGLRFVEEVETLVLARPRLAAGLEWAQRSSGRRYILEVGVAFGLPERISRDVQRGERDWHFEAERSLRGPLFPFYALRMKV